MGRKKKIKNEDETKSFVKRRPDFRGNGVSAWLNQDGEKEWLSIKVDGINKTLVAFKNINGGE